MSDVWFTSLRIYFSLFFSVPRLVFPLASPSFLSYLFFFLSHETWRSARFLVSLADDSLLSCWTSLFPCLSIGQLISTKDLTDDQWTGKTRKEKEKCKNKRILNTNPTNTRNKRWKPWIERERQKKNQEWKAIISLSFHSLLVFFFLLSIPLLSFSLFLCFHLLFHVFYLISVTRICQWLRTSKT